MAAAAVVVDTPPLNGRIAIITGATGGIGRAIAIHLRSLGAKLVISYAANSTQANQLTAELSSSSDPSSPVAIAVKADVSNEQEVKLLFDQAEQAFGCPAHILVNCAGILDPKYPTLAKTSVENWDNTFNINTKGAFLCCREAANRLNRGGGGRIVLITTSIIGSPIPGYGAYAASKAAVETMTRVMAKELKDTGITVNCVAPGPVATDLFYTGKTESMIQKLVHACPMGRLGEPEDVAPLVGFLVSDGGGWVHGQVVRVNGGFVV